MQLSTDLAQSIIQMV